MKSRIADQNQGVRALKKTKRTATDPAGKDISFYHSWCKRCGNCLAFCPRQALETDAWGYPRLAEEGRCSRCGLCEMLCPDLAISLGEGEAGMPEGSSRKTPPEERPVRSPERLAPRAGGGDDD
jgi:2-oxoglutarate ferredoxin oxidoreductase subunit delta